MKQSHLDVGQRPGAHTAASPIACVMIGERNIGQVVGMRALPNQPAQRGPIRKSPERSLTRYFDSSGVAVVNAANPFWLVPRVLLRRASKFSILS
jgi:hypothetical protein